MQAALEDKTDIPPEAGEVEERAIQMLCMEGDIDHIINRVMSGQVSKKRVLRRTLDILIGLSLKGYEGKPVGAIFLIGDIEGIRRHTSQMIINPFKGWRDINILDEKQMPTFEAFCQLDGAFVLDHRGFAHYAGRMIQVRGETDCGKEDPGKHPIDRNGTGTRSRASRYITERTKTIAVSLSHSGEITLFERGKEIGRITRKVVHVDPKMLKNLVLAGPKIDNKG
ncbi:MAG: diadenylate cyclase [Candidatus Thermoplasmatota archaeon]|nr:diadenylate cyclase [Candidatus Thermoplasmatota archaeon]